jgi:hypothetical protein
LFLRPKARSSWSSITSTRLIPPAPGSARVRKLDDEAGAAARSRHIENLGRTKPIQVGCFTCHHGVVRPEPLEVVIGGILESSGIEAAVERYRAMRKEHYGSAAYDFGESPLNRLGETLLRAGEKEAAAALLELKREFHPDSAWLRRLLEEARKVRELEE